MLSNFLRKKNEYLKLPFAAVVICSLRVNTYTSTGSYIVSLCSNNNT